MKDALKEQFKNLRKSDLGMPNKEWVEASRSTLMMQVKNTVEPNPRPLSYLERAKEVVAAFAPIDDMRVAGRVASVIVLVGGIVFGSSVTTVSASLNSVPGDLLYPLKRITEEAQVRLTSNAEAKAELHIEFAGRRVQEVSKITDSNSGNNVSRIAKAVKDFKQEMETASQYLDDPKSEPEKVVQMAKIIDAKSEVHQQILGEVEKKVSEGEALGMVQGAKEVAEDASVKAVEVMVVAHTSSSSTVLSMEEVQDSVTNKINDIEKRAEQMVDNSSATSTPSSAAQVKTAIGEAREAISEGDFVSALSKIKESTELVRAVTAVTVTLTSGGNSSTPALTGSGSSGQGSGLNLDGVKVRAQSQDGSATSSFQMQNFDEIKTDESSSTPRIINP